MFFLFLQSRERAVLPHFHDVRAMGLGRGPVRESSHSARSRRPQPSAASTASARLRAGSGVAGSPVESSSSSTRGPRAVAYAKQSPTTTTMVSRPPALARSRTRRVVPVCRLSVCLGRPREATLERRDSGVEACRLARHAARPVGTLSLSLSSRDVKKLSHSPTQTLLFFTHRPPRRVSRRLRRPRVAANARRSTTAARRRARRTTPSTRRSASAMGRRRPRPLVVVRRATCWDESAPRSVVLPDSSRCSGA